MSTAFNVSKTKTYNPDLAAIKRRVNITPEETEWDDELIELHKVATDEAEQYIKKDIAPTNVQYDFTDFSGSMITLQEGNYQGNMVIITGGDTLTEGDDYQVRQTVNTLVITFTQSQAEEDVTITFDTGYPVDQIPPRVAHAINHRTGDLFDAERSDYIPSSMKNADVFGRLLNTTRNIFG